MHGGGGEVHRQLPQMAYMTHDRGPSKAHELVGAIIRMAESRPNGCFLPADRGTLRGKGWYSRDRPCPLGDIVLPPKPIDCMGPDREHADRGAGGVQWSLQVALRL